MPGRPNFPLMDDIASVTFNLSMNTSAIGKRWQGIISLNTPLTLDNRGVQPAYFATLYEPKWYGPSTVQIQMLSNDIKPASGFNTDDPRYNVVYTLQLTIDVPGNSTVFSNEKLVLWGSQAAPESPITVTTWATLPSYTATPFSVKQGNVDIQSKWLELGSIVNRMTSAQRNALVTPAEGLTIYNTTTHTLNFYNGTEWRAVTSTTA